MGSECERVDVCVSVFIVLPSACVCVYMRYMYFCFAEGHHLYPAQKLKSKEKWENKEEICQINVCLEKGYWWRMVYISSIF